MMAGRWVATIEFLTRIFFWGIGYFFGFTLVTMLSVGSLFAEEFSFIVRDRPEQHRFWLFRREGNLYLVVEAVAAIGWFFLLVMVWTIALLINTWV